ncbi:MFS transporter [Aliagarivorans marinus]|uniref:MFS transporter n=1 Tax=Aliagarivorans marinus TaxID=561965 RepID=UPI000406F0E2|nr:MFS transporter [Aliagarivorans marinus]
MLNRYGEPVTRREVLGWALYDVANSSYTTVVISLVYSVFFVNFIVPEGAVLRDSYWSLAIAISTVITLVISPLVGVLCDYSGNKKAYLLVCTLACSVFTALLFFVAPGQIWLGIALIVLSNVPWMMSEAFCGALLTDISNEKNISRLSGIGWGIGYLGGLLSIILVNFGIVTADPDSATASYVSQVQWAMVAIALYYVIFSLPTFLLVKDRYHPHPEFEKMSWKQLLALSTQRLRHYRSVIADAPQLFKFFIAFTVYSAGVAVIIKFVGIYAVDVVELSPAALTQLFILLQFSALGGAIAFGYLEAFIGPKNTVLATLLWWMAGVLGIYFLTPLSVLFSVSEQQLFFVIALVAGGGIGSTQSASRAVVGLLSPKGQSAAMFGFWGMFSRVATLLGMSFGLVSDAMGRQQGILLVLAFFIIGSLLLLRVPFDSQQPSANAQ